MYQEFAYSHAMQLILAVIAFVCSFVFLYLIANLMSQLFEVKVSRKQKSIFALLIGVLFNQVWAYSMYFLMGMRSFPEVVYALVATPNPVFAMFYYLIGVKVLHLSPIRSIKLMGHVFLYYIASKALTRLIGAIFFVQSPGPYNYMLDAANQVAAMLVFLVVYFVTQYLLKRYKRAIDFKDSLFVNYRMELVLYFIKATVIYALMVGVPLMFAEKAAANFVNLCIILLIFFWGMLGDMYQAAKNGMANKDVCISLLSRTTLKGNDNGAAALSEKINDNPALVSMLLDKYSCAEELMVKMKITLQGSLQHLHMDNIDVCRVVSSLLDSATASAARCEDNKWVHFAIESKADKSKLIIVSNSVREAFDANKPPPAEHGSEIVAVSKIMEEYGNCSLQTTYHNRERSVYLEMKPSQLYSLVKKYE